MWTDLRHAFRALTHSRSVVALSVICLGLGIGIVTMAFSVVNGVMLQPMPFRDPERLLQITEKSARDFESADAISTDRLDDWRRQGLAAELAAVRPLSVTVARGTGSERVAALAATANAIDVLGVRILAGRTFGPDDAQAAADAAMLIDEATWREHFAADPGIIGSRLTVNGQDMTVIGIVPSLTHAAMPGAWRNAAIWLPLGAAGAAPGDARVLTVIARSPQGSQPTQIAAALAAQLSAITAASGHPDWTVRAAPLDLSLSPTTSAMLGTMSAASVFVLLIGCGNVASLLLLQSTARQREIATRLALGASRGRVARQLLMESALVGLASVPAGLLVGWAGRNWILGVSGDVAAALPIDVRVVAVAIASGVFTSLLFGLAPAIAAMRSAPRALFADAGRQATATRPARRLRLAFATGEVVLSLMLLLCASLLARSFANMLDVDRGLDLTSIAVVALGSPDDRRESPMETAAALADLKSRVAALPGVTHAAITDFMPLRRSGPPVTVRRAEDSPAAPARTIRQNGVSAGFFEAMGIDFDAGRPFTAHEAAAPEPVTVVNRRLADLLWPGEDAIGKRVRLGAATAEYVVIGVARNISNWDVSGRTLPTAYVPLAVPPQGRHALVLRTAGDAASAIPAIRDLVAAFDRVPRGAEPQVLDRVSRDAFFRQRTLALLLGVFSILSLLLTAVGLYGVLACFVSQRRRELGIRAALGATRRDLARLVVREGSVVVGIGAVVGLLAGLGGGRVLQSLLFGVGAFDPASVGITVGVLLLIASIASWAPARRAASMDPAIALRNE